MKQFISVEDAGDPMALVQTALAHKKNPFAQQALGRGKRAGLLFLNPSMRTRLSTQIAAQNLGMDAIVFNVGQDGWALEFEDEVIMNGSSVEHVKDAAPILGRYFDILCIRTFPTLKDRELDYSEFYIRQFIRYAGIPVLSLESATRHPLQSLADLMTIHEHWQQPARRPKVVLSWAPHVKALPQCVANSFAEWMNAWGGADFVIAHPEGFELDPGFSGGAKIVHRQEEALEGADFVYVKNWSSFNDYGKTLSPGSDWMLNLQKMKTAPAARIMHCLPVRRNLELGGDLLDSPASLVTEQAANRVWSAQAVLGEMLKTN